MMPGDLAYVVARFGHGRSDICEDDRRHVAVDLQRLAQVLVVDLAAVLRADHDMAHPQEMQVLAYAVMRVLRIVHDAFRQQFAREVQPVEVALGAAVGDVAPPVVGRRAKQFGEERDDLAFELARLDLIRRLGERIADVVDRILQKMREIRVIEILRRRIP